ncbi:RNA chaperone ProQ [Ursidibacter maritimus]|uniref:RNA chaperone ProQ n=1 Tax=Ursidibacter maritimus TaxID=1331689 RepID=A0A949SWY5_9PAST|nr:RNA chaperone ProQ [Ursidibacter maritimus]KAE9540394.1 RNA chaperone ProQ [Ursidibacter maritimus]MBV6524076.1 RNA chaperone ProQ [Ursidibacter maritimus]MBV6524980.1 RNA chaperone ProQ [Ursidibacter maritimus]MBV6527182.1 RNA chaperone ProQ [Ursidibacter maritimus]MBV6529890.1 RNA chaperone ProQ [Ursidibacter maritimus]
MTEQLDLEQNQKTTLTTKEVVAYLAEKFPLCFSTEGEAKPLKIGLFQELAEALSEEGKVSKTLLRQALRNYTANWRYLHSCKEGAVRVGLNGEECGVVDATQAEHAAKSLEQAKAAYAERKAQQIKEQKEKRKAFFKQKAKEENAQKRAEMKKRNEPSKASIESLAALENKFSKNRH